MPYDMISTMYVVVFFVDYVLCESGFSEHALSLWVAAEHEYRDYRRK